LRNEFEDYSNEHNLDKKLNIILFTEKNITAEKKFFDEALLSLLNKGSDKYDIYPYNPLYINQYAPHLIDLKKNIDQDHLELYSKYSSKLLISDGHWIGLVSIFNIK